MNQTYTMKRDQEQIPIEKVDLRKDLGVIVDNRTFTKHIHSKIKKANRNLGLIFQTFTYLDKDIFIKLFKPLVRPHLEYASTVYTRQKRNATMYDFFNCISYVFNSKSNK